MSPRNGLRRIEDVEEGQIVRTGDEPAARARQHPPIGMQLRHRDAELAEHRLAAIVLVGLPGLLLDDRGQDFVAGVAVGVAAARMAGQPVLQEIFAEHRLRRAPASPGRRWRAWRRCRRSSRRRRCRAVPRDAPAVPRPSPDRAARSTGAPYCLKNCGIASRSGVVKVSLPSRTSVATQAPVIAFDRLAISVGFMRIGADSLWRTRSCRRGAPPGSRSSARGS